MVTLNGPFRLRRAWKIVLQKSGWRVVWSFSHVFMGTCVECELLDERALYYDDFKSTNQITWSMENRLRFSMLGGKYEDNPRVIHSTHICLHAQYHTGGWARTNWMWNQTCTPC